MLDRYERRCAEAAHRRMTVARRYLLLGLRLGRLVDGLVDFYYGPEELQALVNGEPTPDASALRSDARALLADIAADGFDAQRARWLSAQVEGLECVAQMLSGEEVPWSEAVRRCYGIEVEVTPESAFEAMHGRLDAALPGSGGLADRLARWNESQEVPAARALDAFAVLSDALRERTRSLVELPQGERLEAFTVAERAVGSLQLVPRRAREPDRAQHRPARPLALLCADGRARGLPGPPHGARVQGGTPRGGARPARGGDLADPHARVPRLRGHRRGRGRGGLGQALARGRRGAARARRRPVRRRCRRRGDRGVPRAARDRRQRRPLRERGRLVDRGGRRVLPQLGAGRRGAGREGGRLLHASRSGAPTPRRTRTATASCGRTSAAPTATSAGC